MKLKSIHFERNQYCSKFNSRILTIVNSIVYYQVFYVFQGDNDPDPFEENTGYLFGCRDLINSIIINLLWENYRKIIS